MKKVLRITTVVAFLLAAPLFMLAQNPPHPNGGGAPTPGSNTPVGGGAPVGGGLIIMMALGAASKKLYKAFK